MPRRGTVTLTVTVPSGYTLPEFYDTSTPEAVGEALHLGATLHTILKGMKAEETNTILAELETKKQTELARIREQSAAHLKELQAQLAAAHVAHESLKDQMNVAVSHERSTQVQRHADTIASLQTRAQLIINERDADIHKAEERIRAALALALDEKQRTIERQQRENDKLAALLEKNSEKLDSLSQTLLAKRLQNTKAKGEEFESIFREKLIQAYGTGPNFSIEDTSKNGIGHAGDHIMNWDGKKILWEVKNYDRPVPSTEVDKFYRDMTENPTITIGVMVSRYTPITGKNHSGNKHIEFVSDKMLLYLNHFDSMGEDTLAGLMLLFKMYWHASRNFESREETENAVRTIEKLHTESVKAKTEWKLHKAHNDAMARWAADLVEKNEECLHSALKTLQGSVRADTLVIPKNIFRDVSGEEKAMDCMRHLLDITTVEEGASCELRELAEAVAKRMNLSNDTVKDKIKGLLLDAAFVPNKGKSAARILGLKMNSCITLV